MKRPQAVVIIVFFLLASISALAVAQNCSDLCVHTPSVGLYTQAIYIAQGFQVTQPSRITAFTVQLQSPPANGTQTLVSAALYADMNGTVSSQPAAQLANADFNISSPGVVGGPPGNTTQTYYATSGSSAPQLDPGFYWLKLTLPFNLMAWHQANNTYVPDMTSPIRYTKFVSSGSATDWPVQSTTTTAYLVLTGCYLSASPSPAPSPLSFPSSSPSPYASAAPPVQLLTTDVSASFDDQAPGVNVSTTTSGSPSTVVSSSFKDIDINGSTLPSDGLLGGYTVESSNTTGVGGQVETTTYAYRAQIDSTTSIEQTFTFSNTPKPGDFFGSAYVLAAGSVKWSVNLTVATTSGGASTSGGVTLRYTLAGLQASTANSSSANGIVRLNDSPKANMTTYFLQLSAESMAKIEVFDIAFIDSGGFQYITHDILGIPSNTSAPDVVRFELVLRFPGFNNSLLYDPSLGLGVLVGSSNGQSGGSDNSAMIVAVAVAVPVAVALVVVVVAAAIGVAWWRKRRLQDGAGVVNFDGRDQTTSDRYEL